MSMDLFFRNLPFWELFLITVLGLLVSIEAGLRLGRWTRERNQSEADSTLGTMVGAMLGLLAFILAFTFGMAASQFESRRMAVLKESNAIGTAYLRADFMPEPERAQIRALFRGYVDARLEGPKLGKTEAAIERSEKILDALWSQVSTLADKKAGTPLTALFVSALNEVIDVHSERVTLGLKRIPGIIWLALYFVTFLSMLAVGYQCGIGGRRSILGTVVLALIFSAVMLLIKDLDSPRRGFIRISQHSMEDLQKSLGRADANRLLADGRTSVSEDVSSLDQK